MGTRSEVALIVPTRNPGPSFRSWLEALEAQTLKTQRILLDTASRDGTPQLARRYGFEVYQVHRFDHGLTRQWALDLTQAPFLVYMTQDALLAEPRSLERLVAALEDPRVGGAYGRQLPRPTASILEAAPRRFNYPPQSMRRSRRDIPRLGMRAAFFSNAFAAYRREALLEVGGFPPAILGEDMAVAARMLLAGWELAYVAEAQVVHSHPYTLLQEFSRSFDIGVFHSQHPWLLQELGPPEGEGLRYLRFELASIGWHPAALVSLTRAALRYAGYRLGRLEPHLPRELKRRLSAHPTYWD